MHDPFEVLGENPLFTLWHKDPCTDGTDSSCRHAVMRYPYVPGDQDGDATPEQEARFTADFRRATRRQWLHVHHWRLSRGRWLRRRARLLA